MSTLARVLVALVALGALVLGYALSTSRPAPRPNAPEPSGKMESWADLGFHIVESRSRSESDRAYARLGIPKTDGTWDLRSVKISLRRSLVGGSNTEIACDGYGNVELMGYRLPGGAIAAEMTIDPTDLLPVLDDIEDLDFFAVAEPRFALPSDTVITSLSVRCGDRSRTLDSCEAATTPSRTTQHDRTLHCLQNIAAAFDRAAHTDTLLAMSRPPPR